jgi:integrase
MGVTVRQKEKGKGKPWWVVICHQGKRKSVKIGDKTAAENFASKIREELKTGTLDMASKKKKLTFGEYAQKWLDGYGETHLKYSTLKGYQVAIRVHLGNLTERPLDQITRAEIKEIIFEKLKTGLSPKTVTNIKALISSILSNAVEDELIAINPAIRMGKFIKNKDRKSNVNFLTREEAQLFLEAVGKHFPRYYPFFLCALRTGMRLGELRALEWGDVDFQGGFIEVRRAYVRGAITTPKNGKSRRIDMSRQLAETLKSLLVERKREALAKGWGEIPGQVFVNEDGGIIHEANLRNRVFFKALTKAGLRRIRIHDLRHTFASLLLQNGESIVYVKDQLGHSSISITVDIYGHLVPGANRQAVDRLDDDVSITYAQKAGCV